MIQRSCRCLTRTALPCGVVYAPCKPRQSLKSSLSAWSSAFDAATASGLTNSIRRTSAATVRTQRSRHGDAPIAKSTTHSNCGRSIESGRGTSRPCLRSSMGSVDCARLKSTPITSPLTTTTGAAQDQGRAGDACVACCVVGAMSWSGTSKALTACCLEKPSAIRDAGVDMCDSPIRRRAPSKPISVHAGFTERGATARSLRKSRVDGRL